VLAFDVEELHNGEEACPKTNGKQVKRRHNTRRDETLGRRERKQTRSDSIQAGRLTG